ncbi:MAG: ParA family protein [Anaerolineaceae bacterium]|nr:ParA family protein [Anaerolineaceae bacterium]
MILTISNHKGGVGKTTVSTLLAAYAAKNSEKKILLIDVDHNRGSSSIFFTNREPEHSIMEAFQIYADNPYDTDSVTEAMKAACMKAPGFENLYVLQSSRKLSQITALGLEAESLKDMIEISGLDRFPLVIIDSGNVPCVVSMCISACDKLIIPMMMSQQCVGPTRNTINLAKRKHANILGLIPLTVGKSKWDMAILENWKEIIADSSELGWDLGLMEGIPQSKTVVKADLVNGTFPKVAAPVMRSILESIGFIEEDK